MGASVESYMRNSDAFSWYMERDPVLRSTIVAVVWLDGRPDWDALVDRIDRVSRQVPLFRMRLLETPGRIAAPRWVCDPDFDLTWHVRRVEAPQPHDRGSVVALARVAAMSGFDPVRPLWEATLVEGLEGPDGEESAIVLKLHHSLTDGVGGMELSLLLFDQSRTPDELGPLPTAPAGEVLGPLDLARDGLTAAAARTFATVRHDLAALVPAVANTARHPVQVADDVVATAAAIGHLVAPVAATLSPIMTERGLGRHLDLVTVTLDDLKRAAAFAGGTVNDGFLAGVTGGLRRYHERHGEPVKDLRVTVPVSLRTADDPVGGNRITLQRLVVPVDVADPAERIRALHALCANVRLDRSLPYTDAVAGALNLLPASVVQGLLKRVDFLASDVVGFPFPVYLAGAKVRAHTAFGPTTGTAVNTTLLSYDGTCSIGVTIDTAAVRDPEELVDCLVAGFDEVLALAGEHQPVLRPLRMAATPR